MLDMRKTETVEIVIFIVMIMIFFYPFYQYTGNQVSVPSKATILGNDTTPGGGGGGSGSGETHHGTGRDYGTGGLTGNLTEEEDETPEVHKELPIDLGYPKFRKIPGPIDNTFWRVLLVVAVLALLFWYYIYIRRKTKDK